MHSKINPLPTHTHSHKYVQCMLHTHTHATLMHTISPSLSLYLKLCLLLLLRFAVAIPFELFRTFCQLVNENKFLTLPSASTSLTLLGLELLQIIITKSDYKKDMCIL